MNFLLIIIGFLLLVLVVFSAWNFFTMKRLANPKHPRNNQLNDEKYYELKYKQESIIAVGTILVGVGTFIGFSTKENLETQLAKDINTQIKGSRESINKLENQLEEANKKINNDVNLATRNLNNLTQKSNAQLENFSKKIDALSENSILKEGLFFTEKIVFNPPPPKERRYYFNNIKTIGGKPLPKFDHAPGISIMGGSGWSFYVKKVTTEYVEISYIEMLTVSSEFKDPVTLNLIISKI